MAEEIMSIRQTGNISDYCSVFQDWFKRVQIPAGFSDFYGVYLFICGLEPKIWDVFASWHQYSCNTVDDVISLALKIDANGLRDSFSPFDPQSSFYKKELKWDTTISLDKLMKDNEFFRKGMIQKTIIDKVIDDKDIEKSEKRAVVKDSLAISENIDSAYKVFDEMPEPIRDEYEAQFSDIYICETILSESPAQEVSIHEISNVIVEMDDSKNLVTRQFKHEFGSLCLDVHVQNSPGEVVAFQSFGNIVYFHSFGGEKSLKEGVVGMGMVMDNFGWKPGWLHCLDGVAITLEIVIEGIVNESEIVKNIEEVRDDVVVSVTRIGLLSKSDMVKRTFVFSNIEFDQASKDSFRWKPGWIAFVRDSKQVQVVSSSIMMNRPVGGDVLRGKLGSGSSFLEVVDGQDDKKWKAALKKLEKANKDRSDTSVQNFVVSKVTSQGRVFFDLGSDNKGHFVEITRDGIEKVIGLYTTTGGIEIDSGNLKKLFTWGNGDNGQTGHGNKGIVIGMGVTERVFKKDNGSDGCASDWVKLKTKHPMDIDKRLVKFVSDIPINHLDKPPSGLIIGTREDVVFGVFITDGYIQVCSTFDGLLLKKMVLYGRETPKSNAQKVDKPKVFSKSLVSHFTKSDKCVSDIGVISQLVQNDLFWSKWLLDLQIVVGQIGGNNEATEKVLILGVNSGLVWISFSVEVQIVNDRVTTGRGSLHLTRQLGKVIKESGLFLDFIELAKS